LSWPAGADVATACRSAGISDATLRREILNAEWFATTRQAQTVINQWLRQYNPMSGRTTPSACDRQSLKQS